MLFGKHIDKLPADEAKGIRTLPVILGDLWSRRAVLGMLIAQLGVVVYLVATGYFNVAMLLCLGAAPSLRRVWEIYKDPRPDAPPPDLPDGIWPLWYVAITFWYNRRFGLLFLVGLAADILVTKLV